MAAAGALNQVGEKVVLIAGAGPVGLAAALVLADAGIRVKVFEAADGIAEDPRASTFHPPTLEMFDRFGITPELHEQGLVCPTWQIRWHPKGERAVFDLSVLQDDTRYPYRLQCEQWRLTRAAHERLKGNPLVEISFGAGVGGLEQDAEGVSVTVMREGGATEQVKGDFLIGADGAHSFVRKAIDGYFKDLDGEKARGVYDMVINSVEKPLLESVLHKLQGNQSHAAVVLGINRNTLRKKMKAHGIKG